jgi:predicted dehydrogenase
MDSKEINIAIIGYGYWGPNLLRNFSNHRDCNVKYVCDISTDKLKSVKRNYPNVNLADSVDVVLNDKQINCVVISTPVDQHYPIAKKALENNCNVLVEKPMTDSYAKCEELIKLASDKDKVLMVDHTFLYTGSVRKIKELIDTNAIGKIQYFDSTRINLGIFQRDINVLWDLAAHDLSILKFICSESPKAVQAIGVSHTTNKIENIAYLLLHYDSGMIAHFNCSWSSPVKIRQILIGGDKKMILYNDIESTEKVKIYDTGYNVQTDEEKTKLLVDYRVGDVYIPKVDIKEALAYLTDDFVQAVMKKREPVSGWEIGREVVKILEASDVSLKNNGKLVELDS